MTATALAAGAGAASWLIGVQISTRYDVAAGGAITLVTGTLFVSSLAVTTAWNVVATRCQRGRPPAPDMPSRPAGSAVKMHLRRRPAVARWPAPCDDVEGIAFTDRPQPDPGLAASRSVSMPTQPSMRAPRPAGWARIVAEPVSEADGAPVMSELISSAVGVRAARSGSDWSSSSSRRIRRRCSGRFQITLAMLALMTTSTRQTALTRPKLNKVPEVTIYFWVIKVLCTTVGETAADFLNDTVGLGLTRTALVMSVLLGTVLVVQFRLRAYVAGIYWVSVVLISIVGTLITDELTDGLGVPLEATTTIFTLVLAGTFALWYAVERTLSIHTILTTRREAFYWAAVLFTFALGTAAGDLVAERLDVGYPLSVVLFGALIAVVAGARLVVGLHAITAFWIAYVLTRPLGASIGDYLSQAREDGGLGLGTTVTSGLFLALICALVIYLTVSRRDRTPAVQS
ncbi:hypothetical protein ACFOY4_09985 [Actinomadura syzygii]